MRSLCLKYSNQPCSTLLRSSQIAFKLRPWLHRVLARSACLSLACSSYAATSCHARSGSQASRSLPAPLHKDPGLFRVKRQSINFGKLFQSRSGRHPGEDHRCQPGTGRGRTASPADSMVPQRLGVVDRQIQPISRKTEPQADPGTGSRKRDRSHASAVERTRPFLRRRGAAALHRKRNKQRAAFPRPSQCQPLREGRHQQLRGPGQSRCREPREAGHQGRCALSRDDRSRPVSDRAAASDRPQRDDQNHLIMLRHRIRPTGWTNTTRTPSIPDITTPGTRTGSTC